MILRPMPPAEVRNAWGWFRNGLLHVAERAHALWIPEDVYVSILAGQAHAYAVESKGDDVGFAIVQRTADPDGPCLFLWALWLEPSAAWGYSSALLQQFDMLARSIGAKRVRMNSPRKGWVRYFDVAQYVYEREV